MFGIKQRNLTDELMDDPNLDPKLHKRALDGLQRINWVTGAYRPVTKEVLRLAKVNNEPISVLDIACGGGDLLSAIGKSAKRKGAAVDLYGLDISQEAIAIAQARAGRLRQAITFKVSDVFDTTESNSYDVVCCSLFLHHLTFEKAIELLQSMKRLAKRMVLVADLKRSVLGYFYAVVGPRMLTTSRIVHVDGVKSVRGAFSLNEVRQLMNDANMHGAELVRFWPQRFLLRWAKDIETDHAQ